MDTLKIGNKAPNFMLPDINGVVHSLDEARGKIVVMNFWSADCVWCERIDHELLAYIERWGDAVMPFWIAPIQSESELSRKVAEERKLPTVLVDVSQHVADLYGAQTTPHFFIIDAGGKLAYQGAWDDITFRQRVATKVYVPAAVEALMNGLLPVDTQTPAYGCVLVRLNSPGY